MDLKCEMKSGIVEGISKVHGRGLPLHAAAHPHRHHQHHLHHHHHNHHHHHRAAAGPECAGCQKPIRERFLLKALDRLWHEDCLKCACCDCRLGEVGSTLFTKANLILCKRDYLRLFGTTGLCSACNKSIPAFEMVMRARGNVYHLDCFACQHCNHRFCVGDKFYLHDNKILCEFDHEERLLFRGGVGPRPAAGGGPPPPYGYSSLDHLKRQTENLTPSHQAAAAAAATPDDASSGYGSPDSFLSDGK